MLLRTFHPPKPRRLEKRELQKTLAKRSDARGTGLWRYRHDVHTALRPRSADPSVLGT